MAGGCLVAIGLTVVLGLTSGTVAMAAVAAGMATATAVLGFELLRRLESSKLRFDDDATLVDLSTQLTKNELDEFSELSATIVGAATYVTDKRRTQILNLLEALNVAQDSKIVFFRDEARRAFYEAIEACGGSVAQ
jgi:hypothetical protein